MKNTPQHYQKGYGCGVYIILKIKIDGETCSTNGCFLSVLCRLMLTVMLLFLFNYPSTHCRLGYHGV